MDFTNTILRWYAAEGRALPWRETKDAYAIWLSEIILQQTRARQGQPYWERFMRRWPTVEALAEATEDEVLRAWQGLGYYGRARRLLLAARQVVERGAFPDTLEGIKALQGVGDYTAAAVGSMAFGLPVAAVDGNVYRVLARHFGVATPIDSGEGRREFRALAQRLLPADRASDFNQAMMDFGAMQCTPLGPQCGECPLQDTCVAWREGRVAELPVKGRRTKTRERRMTYVYIRHDGRTAIRRRPEGDIWQGLYEPWLTDTVPAGAVLLRQNVRHELTHRVIYADFWLWQPEGRRPVLPTDYFWINESEIDNYGVPRLVEKLLEALWKE